MALGIVDSLFDQAGGNAGGSATPAKIEGGGGGIFLSNLPAGRRERRLALAVVVFSALTFLAAVPFAQVPLLRVDAFIPTYEAALAISDLITAVLLIGQFRILRTRALLVLACGYIYTALIMVPHALTYPGVFAATGLLGAGPQSTAWLYMFWHSGFPLMVAAYAILSERDARAAAPHTIASTAVLPAVLAVVGVVCGLALVATVGKEFLPPVMQPNGTQYTPVMFGVASSTWAFSGVALFVLWRRRQRSVLDVWLMVVMCVWLMDVALSAVLNAARFDLGFYVGRIYGLLAANFILVVLVLENSTLYARLARSFATEKTKADEAHSLNQRIFETSPDLVMVVGRRGNFIQIGPSSATIIGYRPEEMVGRSAIEFIYPADLENTRQEMRQARRGRVLRNFDCRYVHKDGHAVPLAWTGTWSEAEQQHIFIGRDMSERIAAEERLRRSQRLEAVGQLTGGLAHDFNNLLGIVIGNLDLIQDEIPPDHPAVEYLGIALDACFRGAQLNRSLLAFARRQDLQPQRVEPSTVIQDVGKMLQRVIGERVELKIAAGKDVWSTCVDLAQLESAILNLAVNARDAMPDGGRLVLETSNAVLDSAYAAENVEVTAGEYALIAISDTGTGMTQEVLHRVFEPFFTTKEVGKGTGLGLSMVHGFIKQSQGHVKIYSEPGRGTTVRLYLPRDNTDPRSVGAAHDDGDQHEAATGTILVVEDNEALRLVTVTKISKLGYRVIEAGSAAAALHVMDSGARPDLIFTDVVMPGALDGLGLAREAVKRIPGLKVLLTSGFTERTAGRNAERLPWPLLAKPYRRPELAQALRQAMAPTAAITGD
jgi:PAS domain S-box-containing protein